MTTASRFPQLPVPSLAGALAIAMPMLVVWCADSRADAPGQLRIKQVKQPAGWRILVGDEVFAGYRFDDGGKPIVYPLIGPGGQEMTRNFPMKRDVPGERDDHDHHRSMWLTHGEVNGVDFWLDDQGCGRIVHTDGTASLSESGSAVLITDNDWLDPRGQRVLSDTRRFEFSIDGSRRIIDCDVLLKASDGDVNFGDTKEGTFGIRVAGSMKVDANQGGIITNAEELTNKDAWGKPSAWVDYSGPVDRENVGITVHAHPSGFGAPCRWHVRTYGLFAANPFGIHHFEGGPKRTGIVLREGTKMRLNYRVVLHTGLLDIAAAKKDAEQYANEPRPELE
jgi:hypothetical protein